MEVLKKGNKGEAVKVLQKALGITADGIFGPSTERTLIAWQKKHGLVADGIAGEKTLTALGIKGNAQTSMKAVDASVVYNPLNVHITPCPDRPITYLVVHFTAGSNSATGRAMNVKNTFISHQASADFAVDDETMVQFNPDLQNYFCWAVGGKSYGNKGGGLYGKARNKNCISIEMCSTCTPSTQQAVSTDNHKGWSLTDATVANCRKLARILMKKYNIPKERVIRHYDVTGKLCPGVYGWNDEPLKDLTGKKTGEQNNSLLWQQFKESL